MPTQESQRQVYIMFPIILSQAATNTNKGKWSEWESELGASLSEEDGEMCLFNIPQCSVNVGYKGIQFNLSNCSDSLLHFIEK